MHQTVKIASGRRAGVLWPRDPAQPELRLGGQAQRPVEFLRL